MKLVPVNPPHPPLHAHIRSRTLRRGAGRAGAQSLGVCADGDADDGALRRLCAPTVARPREGSAAAGAVPLGLARGEQVRGPRQSGLRGWGCVYTRLKSLIVSHGS